MPAPAPLSLPAIVKATGFLSSAESTYIQYRRAKIRPIAGGTRNRIVPLWRGHEGTDLSAAIAINKRACLRRRLGRRSGCPQKPQSQASGGEIQGAGAGRA